MRLMRLWQFIEVEIYPELPESKKNFREVKYKCVGRNAGKRLPCYIIASLTRTNFSKSPSNWSKGNIFAPSDFAIDGFG